MSAEPARFPYEPTIESRGGQQPAPILVVSRADRIHWLSVWNGFFPSLTVMILFGLFGLGVGFANTAAAGTLSAGAVIWGLVTVIVAFVIGGFVASATSGVRSGAWGLANGLMVFLVALPVLMVLGALGLGYVSGGIEHQALIGGATQNGGAFASMNYGWSFILAAVGLISAIVGGWAGAFTGTHPVR